MTYLRLSAFICGFIMLCCGCTSAVESGRNTALSGIDLVKMTDDMAMRIASKDSAPVAMRLAAMRTGLAAENDKHRFLQAAGVYDVLRYRKAAGEGQLSDIQRLLSLTNEMLNEAEGKDKGFDLKDLDADGAGMENEDL